MRVDFWAETATEARARVDATFSLERLEGNERRRLELVRLHVVTSAARRCLLL